MGVHKDDMKNHITKDTRKIILITEHYTVMGNKPGRDCGLLVGIFMFIGMISSVFWDALAGIQEAYGF